MADPFEKIRGNASPVDPSALDAAELEDLLQTVRDTYLTWAKQPAAAADPQRFKMEERQSWITGLQSSLVQSRHFQRLVLNEELTPGSHEFKLVELNPHWFVGLYVPGFYDVFQDFEEGFAFFETAIFGPAVKGARNSLISIIRKHATPAIESKTAFDYINGRAPLPPTPTNEHVATLFVLAQEEKSRDSLRSNLFRSLHDIRSFLPSLSGGEQVFDKYKAYAIDQIGGSGSLIDKFAECGVNVLSQLGDTVQPKAVKLDADLNGLEQIRQDVEAAGADADADAEDEDLGPGEEQGSDDLTVPGEDEETQEYDPAAQQSIVSEEASSQFAETPSIFYPDCASASKGPVYFRAPRPGEFLQASQESEAPEAETETNELPQTLSGKFRRAKGFVTARVHSARDEEAERRILGEEDIVQGAAAYLKAAIRPGSEAFHKKGYEDCLRWLCEAVERPREAVEAEHTDARLRMFSGLLMYDDWIHVRFLLEALRMEIRESSGELEDAIETVDRYELTLARVFALIRSGADDPLPWILVLDGVLRMLWHDLIKWVSTLSTFQFHLFDELVLWCHGTALNAFVLRIRKFKVNDPLRKWYRALYQYDPTCANKDCLRLLVHPDKMTAKYFRSMLSVGTREARVGRRAVRAFISQYRDMAYTCLFDIIVWCSPTAETVIIIFWFSHFYHHLACKVARGKHAIPSF